MTTWAASHGPYLLVVALVMTGLYMLLTHRHPFRALTGLGVLQSAIILLFVLLAARKGGTVPILDDLEVPMVNPLPHAMMLTAIVVGVATQGVGLALLHRIRDEDRSQHAEEEGPVEP